MQARELKARQIVATGRIIRGTGCYFVPSQTAGRGSYRVVLDGLFPSCTCEDSATHGECKHILAAREWVAQQSSGVAVEPVETVTHFPRKTYRRDWAVYNLSQTTEKDWFLILLSDVCREIPEPERANLRGRPIPMSSALFAAVYKVYSGFSARRFTTDLDDARERGLIEGRTPHFNSVLNVLDSEAATPILTELIARTAAPLRGVEVEFAVDSSGFASSRFVKWFDKKYGVTREEVVWVKAHICCGTKTNIITAAEVLDCDSGDSPQLPGLVETTAKGFRVEQVAADKAYSGRANFDAVDKVGGTLYAAFRRGTTGAAGGLFEKAFHYFCFHRQEYLEKYHRRSMVETTFSMVKRKHGDSVRGKTDRAMRNEVLAKFVAHNICCLVAAVYENGIDPTLFGLNGAAGEATADGPREVIPFHRPVSCTIDKKPAQ